LDETPPKEEVMILVAGSSNLDFVVRAERIPCPGETVLGQGFRTFPGGKGANQAVACARAGGSITHFLTALGVDDFASAIEDSLRAARVVLHVVPCPTEPTGCAFICVSNEGENAITVAPGANSQLRAEHLPALAGFSHVLLQLESPLLTVAAYARAARQQGTVVVLNAAPAQALPQDLLDDVDILVVNEGELATVAAQQGSVADCLRHVRVPTVVVTLGARGCCARTSEEFVVQPGFTVNAVDTTAAGDTFCGVLVAALGQGDNLRQALRIASAAGAMACELPGAQVSIPYAHDVNQFLARHAEHSATSMQALRNYCGVG
jgi:ribokinase